MAELRTVNLTVQHGNETASIRVFDTPSCRSIVRSALTKGRIPQVRFASSVRTIVEVGAHVGATTLYFALRYPDATVHAFEPYRSSYSLLRGNLASRPNIRTYNYGLAGSDREISVRVNPDDLSTRQVTNEDDVQSASTMIHVKAARNALRQSQIDRIDILRINAEGLELSVLNDLGDMLVATKIVHVEYHTETDRRAMDSLLVTSHVLAGVHVDRPGRGALTYVRADAIRKRSAADVAVPEPAHRNAGNDQAGAIHAATAASLADQTIQDQFDVAVVIPTLIRPSLTRAANSVFAQELEGRGQLLIGIDKAWGDRAILDDILASAPANWTVTVFDPGYSTSVRHGGVHRSRDGGALRTILSYMANSRYVAYLDDDNWWSQRHLIALRRAIEDHDWAFSLRWFVDPVTFKPLAIDTWESVGPNAGTFRKTFGGFSDPNTLMIDKTRCEDVLHWWAIPGSKKTERAADRNIFRALSKHYRGRCSREASCYYVMDPNDVNYPRRLERIARGEGRPVVKSSVPASAGPSDGNAGG